MTENEGWVLLAILRNDFTAFNGGNPPEPYTFRDTDWAVWSDCVTSCDPEIAAKLPAGRGLGGTLGSLTKRGLINSDGECVYFTEAGYNAAREFDRTR